MFSHCDHFNIAIFSLFYFVVTFSFSHNYTERCVVIKFRCVFNIARKKMLLKKKNKKKPCDSSVSEFGLNLFLSPSCATQGRNQKQDILSKMSMVETALEVLPFDFQRRLALNWIITIMVAHS